MSDTKQVAIGAFKDRYNDLKERIETMKCCGNCKYYSWDYTLRAWCGLDDIEIPGDDLCEEWELCTK